MTTLQLRNQPVTDVDPERVAIRTRDGELIEERDAPRGTFPLPFVFPTRRRVLLHDAEGRADQTFAPITVDVRDIAVTKGA